MPDLETWYRITLHSMALGQSLFVVLYMTFPWYRTFLGRALFYKAFMLAVMIDLGLIATMEPLLLPWDHVFVILYALLATGIWFQFFAFLRARADGRKRKDGEQRTNAERVADGDPEQDDPDALVLR